MTATVVHRVFVTTGPVVVALVLAAPSASFGQCGPAPANLPGSWCAVDGDHVRVWWEQSFAAAGDEAKAIQIRNDVEERIWPLYEKLLGRVPLSDDGRSYVFNGGDGRYDIVLAPDLLARYGETRLVRPSLPARFSMIRRTLPAAELRGTVAHQLMRGFVGAFRCGTHCRWLEEATATWARHVVYPTTNTEHRLAQAFLGSPEKSLHDDPDDPADPNEVANPDPHKSGSYLFLFFLQHHVAGGPSFIRNVWLATEKTLDALTGLNGAIGGGFRAVWRDFIASNWNAAPMLLAKGGNQLPVYKVWDGLDAGIYRLGRFTDYTGPKRRMAGMAGDATEMDVTLAPLSAKYFLFEFDVSVRHVQLEHHLKWLRDRGLHGAELVVFIKNRGEDWRIEPWNGSDAQAFCRDAPGQQVEQMVVILGNSGMTPLSFKANGIPPRVVTSRTSCLTDRDEGYEECRLEFPFKQDGNKTYQNVETQTWKITRLLAASAASRTYEYAWMTSGGGSATNKSTSTSWNSTWAIQGNGVGQVEIVRRQINGQRMQVVKLVDGNLIIEAVDAVIGEEVLRTGSNTQTSDVEQDWFEFPRPRNAPLRDPRIEGFATSPLDPSWQPGSTLISYFGTITCRWSWPRAQ